MLRRISWAVEVSIITIRVQPHLAAIKGYPKVKWLESNRKIRRTGKNIWEVGGRDGVAGRRSYIITGS